MTRCSRALVSNVLCTSKRIHFYHDIPFQGELDAMRAKKEKQKNAKSVSCFVVGAFSYLKRDLYGIRGEKKKKKNANSVSCFVIGAFPCVMADLYVIGAEKNTIQYNTIQLYCQVINAQEMFNGTKHTHTNTHTSQIKKKKTTL